MDQGPSLGRASRVSRFYDENTQLFLSLGQGTEGTIHRAVWGPGVRNRTEAMAYVDGLIAERALTLVPADPAAQVPDVAAGRARGVRLADLGCGVCASLCRLARLGPISGVGFTISEAQVRLARERIAKAGLAGTIECRQGDFCALPSDLAPVDLAFSIEAFVHAPSAVAYFREAARLVRPGGRLFVCDDFLSDSSLRERPRARRWVERFRKGWVAPSVLSEAELRGLAAASGFVHEETLDLTPFLEIRRPRDYAAGALMRVFGWLPITQSYWLMLYGGHALQICLKKGWIRYQCMVWRREVS